MSEYLTNTITEDEDNSIEVKFYCKDESNNETTLHQIINLYDNNELYELIDAFKHFLLAIGYTQETIQRIINDDC
jgi:hypothetical protein